MEVKQEHLGRMCLGFTSIKAEFNQIVIAGFSCAPSIKTVGRVVQIRRGRGQFGSDQVLIRIEDGTIASWENQSFSAINEEYKELFDEMFKDVFLDEPDSEYSIKGLEPETGFILPKTDKKFKTTIPDEPFTILISKCSKGEQDE